MGSSFLLSASLDAFTNPTIIIRIGIAYAGTKREDIRELLLPAVGDTSVTMEIAAISALALGFVFVGSCDGEVTMTILQTMMEREEAELKEKWARFMSLGLALLYLGTSFVSNRVLKYQLTFIVANV